MRLRLVSIARSFRRMWRSAFVPDADPASAATLHDRLLEAGWVRLARSDQVGRTVVARRLGDAGGGTVLLWRTRHRQPVAVDATCPHRPVSMEGARLVGDALECPVHRRLFAPSGRCLNRPDGKPAHVVEVRELAGSLWCPPS